MKIWFLLALVYAVVNPGNSQNLTASQVIEKSIEYHDPGHLMNRGLTSFEMRETRPNGSDRHTFLELNPTKDFFRVKRIVDGIEVVMEKDGNEFTFQVDGSSEINDEVREKYRLTEERCVFMRNYYLYLWYLPMKLTDPGTILGESAKKVDFFGSDLLEVKVTYEAEVGSDIWYFYFDPKSFALSGYRFYHDETANDGEYILLEGEIEAAGVRLPAKRSWYTHQDKRFLGSDHLTAIKLDAPR